MTSEAKTKDRQAKKSLTPEVKRQSQKGTSEAKPTDTEVDKDLTSEVTPNENQKRPSRPNQETRKSTKT